MRNISILVSKCDPGAWTELADEMRRAADAKKGEATAKRELPPSGSGIVRGGRMISKKEAESVVLEEAAAAFLVVSDQVDEAAASVVSAHHQLHEAKEHGGADEGAADEAAKNHGEGKKEGRALHRRVQAGTCEIQY